MSIDPTVKTAVHAYLKGHHQLLYDFWLGVSEQSPSESSIQDHCDLLYTLYLLEDESLIDARAARAFGEVIRRVKLPGVSFNVPSVQEISVHNFAYVLGALNILRSLNHNIYDYVFREAEFLPEQLVNVKTCRPHFPKKFTHHGWRVSHWLGGVPSILLSLSKSGTSLAGPAGVLFDKVLEVVNEAFIDRRTGFIKAYKSDLLQKIFKTLYGFRHDPHLGDIGGVSHIIWINHVVGRGYVNAAALYKAAASEFLGRQPFMERVPYCLDFDVVQMVRTAGLQAGVDFGPLKVRAQDMVSDISAFMRKGEWEGYSLHKVPGALATYHECQLISGSISKSSVVAGRDVIKDAYWL